MTNQPHALPTLNQICKAHGWKRDYEKYLPISRFVFRPVGFLLTWIAIRMGLTTEGVAWLSGVVGIAACLCLVSVYENMLPVGIGLLLFFNLLDCVDGSIARTMKTENPYGRFLDSLMGWIDMGFWAIVGIMAYRHPKLLYLFDPIGYSPIFWLAVGGLTCYFFILLGYIEGIFDHSVRDEWNNMITNIQTDSRNITQDRMAVKASQKKLYSTVISIIRRINHNLRVRETHYFLLILAYWGSMIDLLLIFFLFYYILHTITLIVIYSIRGRRLRDFLQRH